MEKCVRCFGFGFIWNQTKKNNLKKPICPACIGKGYIEVSEAEEEADYEYRKYIELRTAKI